MPRDSGTPRRTREETVFLEPVHTGASEEGPTDKRSGGVPRGRGY